MWLNGPKVELFVNSGQVAWVTVQHDGEYVRLVYLGGQHLDAHHHIPEESIRDLISQFKADPRFTPIRGGREFVNLGLALRAELDLSDKTGRLYFLGLSWLEFGPEDFDTIRAGLMAIKG